MIKMMIVGRRRPGTTLAQHRHYIRDVHGAMVVRFIAHEPQQAPKRYVQNHAFDGSYRDSAVGSDPLALNRDFVTQVWFDDLPAAMASLRQPFYLEQLQPDEDNFVDQATVVKFPVRERVLKQTEANGSARFKAFVFFKRGADTSLEQFGQAWSEASEAWASSAEASSVRRHVRNDVLARPGEDTIVDGVDEIWADDEAAIRQVAASLQARMGASNAVRPGSTVSLLAEEFVLFAGASVRDSGESTPAKQ